MEKQKFIFDIDGTLLNGDFSAEDEFFVDVLGKEQAMKFIPIKYALLQKYESLFQNYDDLILSEFLSKSAGVTITPKMIKEWIDVNENLDNEVIENAYDVLEYLKSKNKRLAVLTNWFSKTQIGRLKSSHLLEFFDEVYGGEQYLKPNPKSYLQACGEFKPANCVMIGNDLEKDILGARAVGLDTVFYNPKGSKNPRKDEIKKLIKIREMY